jgi:photosystem II stability/assembly factor-like uncharacterized protein
VPAGKPAKQGKRSSSSRARDGGPKASHGLGRAAKVVRAAAERAARASSTLMGSDAANRVALLVGTKKGAWFLFGDAPRRRFRIDGPHFLGSIVNHVVLDPRDRRTLLLASRTGHLGPSLHHSSDFGRSWTEASRPPAFPNPDSENGKPRTVRATFWLTPGHVSQPEVWWAGTVPHGLFRSRDGGVTWDGVDGFNRNPMGVPWTDPHFLGTPDGALTHSVLVDPRDPEHLYVALSIGGLFETRDGGVHWSPLNRGVLADFLPDRDAAYGHDPHCVALHPKQPDRLWQANRCGVYRLDRSGGGLASHGDVWERIGRNLPAEIGDIGFPIVLHPRDPGTAWIFPMDGTAAWPRTSPGGRPAVYRTRDAGATWERQDKGLPASQAWFTVKRQAMAGDARHPAGLYFGTTSGEIWMSGDEGASWRCLASHLPHILSVTVAEFPAAAIG